jgi:uncharacterized protein
MAQASRPFVVLVADLVHRPGARRSEHISAPTSDMRVMETRVPDGAAMVVDATLESVSDGVLADGSAGIEWTAICRRCLGPIVGRTDAAFQELYSLHPVADETYPIRHDSVDLELVAREAILLDLPLAPLCRPDCAGLCPTCGADHNVGSCACAPVAADPRWAELDALRAELPSE